MDIRFFASNVPLINLYLYKLINFLHSKEPKFFEFRVVRTFPTEGEIFKWDYPDFFLKKVVGPKKERKCFLHNQTFIFSRSGKKLMKQDYIYFYSRLINKKKVRKEIVLFIHYFFVIIFYCFFQEVTNIFFVYLHKNHIMAIENMHGYKSTQYTTFSWPRKHQ